MPLMVRQDSSLAEMGRQPMREEMRGARILLEGLIREGVDTIFGYPGGAVLHIYDELARMRSRLRHILAALRMPGALEALDAILHGVDGGTLTAPEAIEQLLTAQIQRCFPGSGHDWHHTPLHQIQLYGARRAGTGLDRA